MPARVCLSQWDAADERGAGLLRRPGHGGRVERESGLQVLRSLVTTPPDAFVIDLDRLPARGRDAAPAIRSRAGTRRVPLVVAGHAGAPPHGKLGIAWPTTASGVESDVSETLVPPVALAAGLVGHVVCAIDVTWSGLLLRGRV